MALSAASRRHPEQRRPTVDAADERSARSTWRWRRVAGEASPIADGSADLCEITCIDGAKVERARRVLPAPATVAALGDTFRALGDPTRLLIVAALAYEELCVCGLAMLVGVSQSAVSHSLRTLRQLRLVRYRKVGKIAYYTLDDAHVARLVGEGLRHVEGSIGEGR